MKVKEYVVTLRNPNADNPIYYVDAPNKRIAKWCGANLYNNECAAFLSAKDMKAELFKIKEAPTNDGTENA